MTRRNATILFHGAVAASLTLLLAALLFAALRVQFHWYTLVAAWLLAVNVTAFAYYGYDKSRAQGNRSRVPEPVLHGLVATGGTLGAYAGMSLFRHKTAKRSFRLLFWFVVFFQVLLLAALISRAYQGRDW